MLILLGPRVQHSFPLGQSQRTGPAGQDIPLPCQGPHFSGDHWWQINAWVASIIIAIAICLCLSFFDLHRVLTIGSRLLAGFLGLGLILMLYFKFVDWPKSKTDQSKQSATVVPTKGKPTNLPSRPFLDDEGKTNRTH